MARRLRTDDDAAESSGALAEAIGVSLASLSRWRAHPERPAPKGLGATEWIGWLRETGRGQHRLRLERYLANRRANAPAPPARAGAHPESEPQEDGPPPQTDDDGLIVLPPPAPRGGRIDPAEVEEWSKARSATEDLRARLIKNGEAKRELIRRSLVESLLRDARDLLAQHLAALPRDVVALPAVQSLSEPQRRALKSEVGELVAALGRRAARELPEVSRRHIEGGSA